ncbi:unnamed protein product [Caenorhabditis angaria]|uniref:7TM GPCR serpentine receptor class x (Srx) domain-containing protein n=1 Tax=Caenorhabditis angaria TaxID=860376 RepID=A0A9P1IVG3_9PELO|nr:unnamed protein product [Caenorhabditis angaria]
MWKLRQNLTISTTTKRLHRQLMLALIIQTLIPCFTNFFPCVLGWYSPILEVDIGKHASVAVITTAAFPIIDPIAVILLLPNYRRRIFKTSLLPRSDSNTMF